MTPSSTRFAAAAVAAPRPNSGASADAPMIARSAATLIRTKQEGFDWPPNAASLERETPEPWLPVKAFPSSMLDALCPFLEMSSSRRARGKAS